MITTHTYYKVRIVRNVHGQEYIEKHEFVMEESAVEYARYERTNVSALEVTLSRVTERVTTEYIAL